MCAVFAQSDCNKDNWQEYYDRDGKDMSDCNLEDANLEGAYLKGADLTKANLAYAELTDANLRGADLTKAELEGANLEGADLSGANLTDANLRDADLRGAVLAGAELNGVKSGKIIGRPLSLPDGWSLVDGTLLAPSSCIKSNWRKYYKSDGKDMSDCDLTGAILEGAYL